MQQQQERALKEAENGRQPQQTAEKRDKSQNPTLKSSPKKLSFKLQQELDTLPLDIERLEKEITEFEAEMASAEFFKQDHASAQKITDNYQATQAKLEKKYASWETLMDE